MIEEEIEELEIENVGEAGDLVEDTIIEGLIEDEQVIDQQDEQVETGELLEEDQENEIYDTENNEDIEEVIDVLEEISNDSIADQVGDSSVLNQDQEDTQSTYTLEDIYQQNDHIITTLEVINRNVKTTGDNISLIGSVISMVLCLFLGGFIIYCFLFRVR